MSGEDRPVPPYYRSAPLEYLPKTMTIPGEPVSQLSIDYIKLKEIPESYSLVEECALTGFNVGLDEYSDFDEYAMTERQYSETFVLRDVGSGKMKGVLLMRPSKEGRSFTPCCVHPYIFLSRDCQTMAHYREILALAVQMATDLKLRYNGVMLAIFSSCYDMITEARKQKFSIVATLPWNGKLKNQPGNQTTHLLYKDIVEQDHDIWSNEEMLWQVNTNSVEGEEYFAKCDLPQVDFLPQQYTMRNGVTVILRNMRREECDKIYSMFQEAATMADGYAIDENPTLQVFKEWVLADCYTVVLEEVGAGKPGEILALFTMSDYSLSRTKERTVCDCNVLVQPSRAGQGIGQEMCELFTGLCIDMGYAGCVSDVIFTNVRLFRMAYRLRYHVIGTLPKCCYVKGRGWTDSMLLFKDLHGERSFLEMVKNPAAPKPTPGIAPSKI